ncbi:MAG: hypothetical protein ABI051_18050 [Vicinamibacterales bacterium]
MKQIFAALVVMALMAAALTAQSSKPSFSGTWKLTSDPSAGPFVASQFVASDDGKVLTVMSTTQMGESKTIYNLDGSPAKSPLDFNGNTMDRTTKATWDGAKLVLTTTSDFGGNTFEIKQVWSLAADGTLSVETTFPDFQGGGAPTTSKATYKKG